MDRNYSDEPARRNRPEINIERIAEYAVPIFFASLREASPKAFMTPMDDGDIVVDGEFNLQKVRTVFTQKMVSMFAR